MSCSKMVYPATFTLANVDLTSQRRQYAQQMKTTAPEMLQNYRLNLSDTDANDATFRLTPQRKWKPLAWLFGFLRDGTTSVPASSDILGTPKKTSLFPQQQATGGLLSGARKANNDYMDADSPSENNAQDPANNSLSQSAPTANYIFPPWSTWKNWKKITLDFYIRLLDTPQRSRLRLKQTIAPLPIIKLKPVIDLAYRGPGKSPLTMHLDVKVLDCLKYRVHSDGSSHLQVRAKAPMSDPRFTMDVIYERELATALDSVKITFRALDVAFLKAPSPGFGFKLPIRFNNGVKSTIRVKKFIGETNTAAASSRNNPSFSRRRHHVTPKLRLPNPNDRYSVTDAGPAQRGDDAHRYRDGIFGPIGVDLKLRCLEYR